MLSIHNIDGFFEFNDIFFGDMTKVRFTLNIEYIDPHILWVMYT